LDLALVNLLDDVLECTDELLVESDDFIVGQEDLGVILTYDALDVLLEPNFLIFEVVNYGIFLDCINSRST
jgi:hypothetical protein